MTARTVTPAELEALAWGHPEATIEFKETRAYLTIGNRKYVAVLPSKAEQVGEDS